MVSVFEELGISPHTRLCESDLVARTEDDCPLQLDALSDSWGDRQRFSFHNLDISVTTGEDESITISVVNAKQEPIDTIQLDKFDQEGSAALLLERLATIPPSESELVEPKILGNVLNQALRLGARIRSTAGGRPVEIVENYERFLSSPVEGMLCIEAFEIDPVSRNLRQIEERSFGEIGLGAETGEEAEREKDDEASIAKIFWVDINTTIVDSAAQRERLDALLQEHIPSLGEHLSREDPIFIDSRLFVQDPDDECRIDRQKFCCYIGSDWVVTVHEGPFEPLNQVTASLRNGRRQSDMPMTPEEFYLRVLHRCQDQNEDAIRRIEGIITSIHSEFIEKGQLSPKALQHEMVVLAKSLGYVTRKLGDYGPICNALRLQIDEEGDQNRRSLISRLDNEAHRIESLTKKAEDLKTALNELIGLNTSISSAKAAEVQRELGIIATVALPLALGASIADVVSQLGAQELASLVIGGALSLVMFFIAYGRKWF